MKIIHYSQLFQDSFYRLKIGSKVYRINAKKYPEITVDLKEETQVEIQIGKIVRTLEVDNNAVVMPVFKNHRAKAMYALLLLLALDILCTSVLSIPELYLPHIKLFLSIMMLLNLVAIGYFQFYNAFSLKQVGKIV